VCYDINYVFICLPDEPMMLTSCSDMANHYLCYN